MEKEMSRPRTQKDLEYRIKNRAKLSAASRARYATKKEEILLKSKARYRKNRSKVLKQTRAAFLAREYGITDEERTAMYAEQLGLCALCDRPLPDITDREIHIDHNHETGWVRGLLHRACNVGIGMFEEDVNLLRKAVKYLERDILREISALGQEQEAGELALKKIQEESVRNGTDKMTNEEINAEIQAVRCKV